MSCVGLEIVTVNPAKEEEQKKNMVVFSFNKKIPASREVMSYSLLSLVAEVS